MLISDIINKDEVSSLVIGELKELGVKYRKEKRVKVCPEKSLRKRIFRTHLHLLELTDVVLANGGIVQIPQFVSDACQRILEHVDIEGLFRKAGSSLRQKEIRINLESGLPLGKSYHVIDVANVLKSFFRELPEPLLPPGIQETLVRSVLIGDDRIRAILMSCLLLPPLTINTLAFFMQFLHTISLNAHLNKMSVDNLAIIFTPGLMPVVPDKTGIRFNNHVKIIRILIENAEMIGVLPENIIQKLNLSSEMMVTPPQQQEQQQRKKKKRRSGSLTRMFNGLRKIVGVIGSSENLEETPDKEMVTPCLTKSAKKRKLADNSGFSAKKKKEILDFMPSGNGGILPNTPICVKEVKKSRLSLGGRRNLKYTSTDKKWSIVGPNWSRKREKNSDGVKKSTTAINQLPPVISMPCIADLENSLKIDLPDIETLSQSESIQQDYDEAGKASCNTDSANYVRIPKSEYEAIKERVAAIETRISQEFGTITRSLCSSSITGSSSSLSVSPISTATTAETLFDNVSEHRLSGPQRVLNQFEKTIEETENISSSSPSTDYLAKRLSRELKIRRSTESRVFRSPSQRKIGSIRRRSKERESVRLSRNKTWHISSTRLIQQPRSTTDGNFITEMSFYPKNCLKRGRPNTLQTGLQPPVSITKDEVTVDTNDKENWISGELFFDDGSECMEHLSIDQSSVNVSTNASETESAIHPSSSSFNVNVPSVKIHIQPVTPKFVTRITINETKTPMLPPKSVPKRTMTSKTPLKTGANMMPKKLISTPGLEEAQNGRASIARLRAQNAGMVLAKAKLFDGLGGEASENQKPVAILSAENRRKSARFVPVSKAKQLEWKSENIIDVSNKMAKLKDDELQKTTRSRTPTTRKRVVTPKQAQRRSRLSIAAAVGGDNKFTERMLLGTLVNEGQITSKGDRSKVTAIRNISTNRNFDSPNNRHAPKSKRAMHIPGNSPRRLIRNAR